MTSNELHQAIYVSQMNMERDVLLEMKVPELRVWISGDSLLNNDCNLELFLEEIGLGRFDCENIGRLPYSIVEGKGIAEFCFKDKVFDWGKYGLAGELMLSKSEDAVMAALELQIDLENFEDQYMGHYESFSDYVCESFDETSLESIPAEFRQYLDYDKIEENWRHGYQNFNGHIFRS